MRFLVYLSGAHSERNKSWPIVEKLIGIFIHGQRTDHQAIVKIAPFMTLFALSYSRSHVVVF